MSPRLLLLSSAALLLLVLAPATSSPKPTGCGTGAVVTLPAARLGQPYARGLVVLGGEPPYAAQRMSGSLPALGLSLSPEGRLSGEPVATGTATFCVEMSDVSGRRSGAQAYQLTVMPRLSKPAVSAASAPASAADPAATSSPR